MALKHTTFEELFTNTANAIREKKGTTDKIVADNFPDEIASIEVGSGGIDTSDATATANDMAEGVSAYVNGNKITGTLEDHMRADASYALNFSDIGVMNSNAIITGIPNNDIIIRSTSGGASSVVPLSNFGNTVAADVILGQTFTSSTGLKQTGTLTLDTEISDQEDLISQITTALEGKSGTGSGGEVTYVGTGLNLFVGDGYNSGYYTTENQEGDMQGYTSAVPIGFDYASGGKETFTEAESIQVPISYIVDLTGTPIKDKAFFVLPGLYILRNTAEYILTIWGYRNLEGWYVGSQAFCGNTLTYTSTFCDPYGNFTSIADGERTIGYYTNALDGTDGFTSILNNNRITLNPFICPFVANAVSFDVTLASASSNYNEISASPDLVAIKLIESE